MTTPASARPAGLPNQTPGQALLEVGRRDIEGGDRIDNLRHTAYRMQIGARGDLGDGWTYDVYAQYGYTLFTENYQNEFSVQRVQSALEVDPATGKCYAAEPNAQGIVTDSNCVPLNIFNGIGSITPAMLTYVGASGFQEGYTEEQIVSGNLTGDLGEYGLKSPWATSPPRSRPARNIAPNIWKTSVDHEFSTGRPLRPGRRDASPFRVSASTWRKASPSSKFRWSRRSPSRKISRSMPATATRPTVRRASVSAYKYGLEWQPIDDFRLRASYERAVRAPNVLEAFSPNNVVLFAGNDPVRHEHGGTMRIRSACRHRHCSPARRASVTSRSAATPP